MKLESNQAIVTIGEKGGEITSFIHKTTGIEYMWQGDAAYWGGKNPTLFPMVGNFYSKSYEIKGKTYAMKNHGLLRYVNFTCVKADEDEVIMQYCADEESLAQYPFPFTFRTIYSLSGKQLTIRYEIENTGEEAMPFVFGLHPGFNCPLTDTETFEDYEIIFDCEEHLQQYVINENSPTGLERKPVTMQKLPLRYEEIIKHGTLIYDGMHSGFVTLKGKEHGVRLSIGGYRYLALWTAKEDAPFICIEPWNGFGDFAKNHLD